MVVAVSVLILSSSRGKHVMENKTYARCASIKATNVPELIWFWQSWHLPGFMKPGLCWVPYYQWSKFKGEFKDLLDHAFIDHHRTSKDHPQANGHAERMVQTCKKGLRKICLTGTKRIGTWPYLTSPWVAGCPNTPLCLISFLTFYFLGDIPFHTLPLLLKWIRLWTWTP